MTRSTFLSREPAWTDADFIGRQAAQLWLAGQLGRETPQNCNLIGEPRVGKTSLLHAVYRRQIGLPPGLRGVYVWARLMEWADRRPAAFWAQLAERIRAAARASGLPLPPAGPYAAAADPAWAAYCDLECVLERWQSDQAAVRVIVLIDDFETIMPDITAQGLDWLRALATRFASILAFVVVTSDPLEQVCRPLMAQQVSPLHNIFTSYHLGLLAEDETEALCRAAAEAEHRPVIQDALAGFLRTEAGRHPDLLKLACECLFQVQDEEGELADPAAIMAAVRSDVRSDPHVRWLCERLYARRTEDERAALRGLVGGRPPDDPILLRRLERKLGLVELRQGQPALFADACRAWLVHPESTSAPQTTAAGQRTTAPACHYRAELREIRVGEQTRKLSAVEDRLFRYLLSKPNQVCTTQELLDQVWGGRRTPSVVEKTVNRLRDKVEVDASRPRLLLSARGEGYLLRTSENA